MAENDEFFWAKRPDRLFVSSSIPKVNYFNGETSRIRIASEIVAEDNWTYATIKDEVVLHSTEIGRFELKATFAETDRRISVLTIQRWKKQNDRPVKSSFSFAGKEITRLLEFVERVRTIHLDGPDKVNEAIVDLTPVLMTDDQAKAFLSKHPAYVIEEATNGITEQDIVALAYRREQLKRFENLLSDPVYFALESEKIGKSGEALWQAFFEQNSWIFGHGLSYTFMTGLDERKLETIVRGADITGSGKRVDALMRTRAHLSSLAFVEIKRHDTDLLDAAKQYRPGTWRVSRELAGGVAQCHETVRAAMEHMPNRLEIEDTDGNPTGESIAAVQPRSFLVVGNLDQFAGEHGPNMSKYRSFEAFRRNLHQPEILTFDELLYRARFIVVSQETRAAADSVSDDLLDDIPF